MDVKGCMCLAVRRARPPSVFAISLAGCLWRASHSALTLLSHKNISFSSTFVENFSGFADFILSHISLTVQKKAKCLYYYIEMCNIIYHIISYNIEH